MAGMRCPTPYLGLHGNDHQRGKSPRTTIVAVTLAQCCLLVQFFNESYVHTLRACSFSLLNYLSRTPFCTLSSPLLCQSSFLLHFPIYLYLLSLLPALSSFSVPSLFSLRFQLRGNLQARFLESSSLLLTRGGLSFYPSAFGIVTLYTGTVLFLLQQSLLILPRAFPVSPWQCTTGTAYEFGIFSVISRPRVSMHMF